eukprot:3956346-Pyramimonas_sp.AAC.1
MRKGEKITGAAGARGAPLTDPRTAAMTRADRRAALPSSTPRRTGCVMHSALFPARRRPRSARASADELQGRRSSLVTSARR